MKLHRIAFSVFAAIAVPHVAEASWGQAIAVVNVRACADVQCPPIGILPAGAQVQVDNSLGGWYQVSFNGIIGYAAARYISIGYAAVPGYVLRPGIVVSPYPRYVVPAQPLFGYAWPGNQPFGYWYDARVRYFDRPWHGGSSGFSLGFR